MSRSIKFYCFQLEIFVTIPTCKVSYVMDILNLSLIYSSCSGFFSDAIKSQWNVLIILG